MITIIEVKVYVFIENLVTNIQIEVVIYMEADFEGWFAIALQNYCVLRHTYLLNSKTWKKSNLFFVLEPIVCKMDVDRWVVDKLEVSLAFEQTKLFIVILPSEVKWNDVRLIFDSILLQQRDIVFNIESFVERSKIMFQEGSMVDLSILLKRNVTHLDLWLYEFHLSFVLVVLGVVVSNNKLKRKIIDIFMAL